MAKIWLRLDFAKAGKCGPGKVALLEAIERTGSIAAAGRALGMSYKRAWDLVGDLNTCFGAPVATTRVGGATRGGAELTELGREIIVTYRAIERDASTLVAERLAGLEERIRSAKDGGTA